MDIPALIEECQKAVQVLAAMSPWIFQEASRLRGEVQSGDCTPVQAMTQLYSLREQSDLLHQSLVQAMCVIMSLEDEDRSEDDRKRLVGHVCRNELTGTLPLLRIHELAYTEGIDAVAAVHRAMLDAVGLD